MSWNFPTELTIDADCGHTTELLLTSMRGVYDGYCTTCGEYIEFNYAEALASEYDERRIDEIRDERMER